MALLSTLSAAAAALSFKYILLAVCALFLLFPLFRAAFSPLRRIPGPFLARFSRLWKLQEYYRGHFEKTNIELHQKYGPIVRLAPNEYSIDDPEAVKIIYGHGTHFTKSTWYYASGAANAHEIFDLFSELDPRRHAANRRKVAAAYSMSNLLQMEPFVDECSGLLHQRFSEFAKSGETIDLGHWLQCYAFDVIGHLTVAKRFGFLDCGADIAGLMKAIEFYLFYLSHVGVFPFLHPILSKIFQATSDQNTGLGYVRIFAQEQLRERLESPEEAAEKTKGGGDFLSKLLTLHAEDPSKVTMYDVLMTCGTNIGAGSDTTAISLSAVMYHLCQNPRTFHELRKEIDTMEAAGQISNPVSFQQAQAMPYLQAVLKEALRMHPATGFPMERVVPKGGANISGQFFPEGTILGVNSWVAHANTSVFGHDANIFRPERWLVPKEAYNKMDQYFMAFGLGSRTCIGKNISLMEMSKVIPQLIRNFDFDIHHTNSNNNGINGIKEGLKTCNRWFVKPQGFTCRVLARRRV